MFAFCRSLTAVLEKTCAVIEPLVVSVAIWIGCGEPSVSVETALPPTVSVEARTDV